MILLKIGLIVSIIVWALTGIEQELNLKLEVYRMKEEREKWKKKNEE